MQIVLLFRSSSSNWLKSSSIYWKEFIFGLGKLNHHGSHQTLSTSLFVLVRTAVALLVRLYSSNPLYSGRARFGSSISIDLVQYEVGSQKLGRRSHGPLSPNTIQKLNLRRPWKCHKVFALKGAMTFASQLRTELQVRPMHR